MSTVLFSWLAHRVRVVSACFSRAALSSRILVVTRNPFDVRFFSQQDIGADEYNPYFLLEIYRDIRASSGRVGQRFPISKSIETFKSEEGMRCRRIVYVSYIRSMTSLLTMRLVSPRSSLANQRRLAYLPAMVNFSFPINPCFKALHNFTVDLLQRTTSRYRLYLACKHGHMQPYHSSLS